MQATVASSHDGYSSWQRHRRRAGAASVLGYMQQFGESGVAMDATAHGTRGTHPVQLLRSRGLSVFGPPSNLAVVLSLGTAGSLQRFPDLLAKLKGRRKEEYDTIRDAILTCARKPT